MFSGSELFSSFKSLHTNTEHHSISSSIIQACTENDHQGQVQLTFIQILSACNTVMCEKCNENTNVDIGDSRVKLMVHTNNCGTKFRNNGC